MLSIPNQTPRDLFGRLMPLSKSISNMSIGQVLAISGSVYDAECNTNPFRRMHTLVFVFQEPSCLVRISYHTFFSADVPRCPAVIHFGRFPLN